MPIEGTQRVVGRLLIPEHDNPGRLLRLVALGLSVEAAGQVPIAAGDHRQPRPDAVEEDSHNLECPSVDLVHELTGKKAKINMDALWRRMTQIRVYREPYPASPFEYFFDGQLQLSPTSPRMGSDRYEGLEEWKGFILD